MRQLFALVAVSLISLTAGLLLRPSGASHCTPGESNAQLSCLAARDEALPRPRAAEPNAQLPCFAADDEVSAPENIDDRAIKRHVELAGGALVAKGEATKMATLIEQLSVRECDLALPRTTLKPPADGLLYEQAKQSVVVIAPIYKCGKCNKWHAGCATGFVISSTGAIVTNYHVVDSPDKSALVVMTADRKVLPVLRVLAASKADDVAILEVDLQGHELTPLPIAKTAAPVGSDVSVISHPSHRYFCYTAGVVSRYTQVPSKDGPASAMTITADFARGSSGGPVLNAVGEVVGIVCSTESIYYTVEKGEQKNLQMVFKTCVPAASLLKLIAEEA